jgi:transcriptional regulator with XRE-family HTH domain
MAGFDHLGAYLRQKRIEAGYSQVDLAKILGYTSSQFISNWERGLSAPPEDSLQVLIKLLKLSRETIVYSMVQDYKGEIEAKIFRRSPKSKKKSS